MNLLRRVVAVRDDEVRVLLLATSTFFLLFFGYSILRPIRDELGIAGGVRDLPWLFTATLVAMLAVHPVYAAVVARLPRRRVIPLVYRFFISNLLLFFLLLQVVPEGALPWVGRTFFVWTSVFNLCVVSVFWQQISDLFRAEQGQRLFGFIAVGGTLGAVAGAGTTAGLVAAVGRGPLLLAAALLLELAARAAVAVDLAPAPTRRSDAAIGGSVWEGVSDVIRSPYLIGICGYMLLYTITATFLYFLQAEVVSARLAEGAPRAAFFARIDLAVNLLTAVTQIFLTGRLMRRLGVAIALAFLPTVCLLGFGWLAVAPSLVAIAVFQILRRAGNYAISRPAREVLYTVVSRDERFKAKQLIDTFVYRAGDQVGAWSWALLGALGLAGGVAIAALPLTAGWIGVAAWLGVRQRERAGDEAALTPATAEARAPRDPR